MSYICKEEALNVLLNKIRDVTGTSCEKDRSGLCVAYYLIGKEIPSADAVQGEWVRKVKEYNDCDGHRAYYWYECSECGAKPPKDTWGNEWHSNFCPSCGARMKGGNNE